MIILTVGLKQKFQRYKMSCFLQPCNDNKNKRKVQLDPLNYATSSDLKIKIGVDTSQLAKKSDISSLKLGIDKLDIGKFKAVPADLGKLSNVVENWGAIRTTDCINLA